MIQIVEPKNTVASVADDLVHGLEKGTITLSQPESKSGVPGTARAKRMNAIGALALFEGSPLKNDGLAVNLLGTFVNQALERGITLDEVRLQASEYHLSGGWDKYFEGCRNGTGARRLFLEEGGTLRLGPDLLTYMREQLKTCKGYERL